MEEGRRSVVKLSVNYLIGFQAPGEAEAELAYLNRIGMLDAVLTDDVDAFLFGAITIIRKSVTSAAHTHPSNSQYVAQV